ncbi:cation transport regulator-like protein 2 [Acephala macrosclerotiorum]|nr:cation transport regulator-like protein 2 [Acephala macrosclerotiorum]
MTADTLDSSSEFWLFGYGSLIWKPPPHFDRRIPGYVTGYVRRFWQDHRGTPEAPGRVVTLIERSFWETLDDHHPSGSDKVWGTAYRIQAEKVAEVREYLDIREINGYTIHYTPFYPSDGSSTIRTLVYIGTPDNDQFMGPQDPRTLAEHIYRSVGPSGPNIDYLLSLEVALDSLSSESGDEHIKDLANRVRMIDQRAKGDKSHATGQAVDHKLEKIGSTDEQEETEK